MGHISKAVIITAIFTLSMASLAQADTTLMSCELQNGRAVKVNWNGENLIYQYGKAGVTPEIELPNNPNDIYSMHFGHLSFASKKVLTIDLPMVNMIMSPTLAKPMMALSVT